jgi:hypothetical protein
VGKLVDDGNHGMIERCGVWLLVLSFATTGTGTGTTCAVTTVFN